MTTSPPRFIRLLNGDWINTNQIMEIRLDYVFEDDDDNEPSKYRVRVFDADGDFWLFTGWSDHETAVAARDALAARLNGGPEVTQ